MQTGDVLQLIKLSRIQLPFKCGNSWSFSLKNYDLVMKLKLYNKGPWFNWSARALVQVIFSREKKITNRVTEIFFLFASNSSSILINLKLVYVSLILHEIYSAFFFFNLCDDSTKPHWSLKWLFSSKNWRFNRLKSWSSVCDWYKIL